MCKVHGKYNRSIGGLGPQEMEFRPVAFFCHFGFCGAPPQNTGQNGADQNFNFFDHHVNRQVNCRFNSLSLMMSNTVDDPNHGTYYHHNGSINKKRSREYRICPACPPFNGADRLLSEYILGHIT